MICIYCKTEDKELFKGVEHLIPQSFGTFGTKTPTLKCVCDACNAYFAKDLDQVLARDSWEGVNRYKQGIKSREQRRNKRLTFSIEKVPEMEMFGGMVLGGIDGTTGKLIPPKGQLQIKNNLTDEFELYFTDQIKNLVLDDKKYGENGKRNIKIFAPSTEEHDRVVEEITKIIPTFKIKESSGVPFIKDKADTDKVDLPIWTEGVIDHSIKRALVKILFNFSAFYIGDNEVLKSEWDIARDYIRNDTIPLLCKIDKGPFWSDETATMRFAGDSFNIIIENSGPNVIGKIQIYNFYTYIFILVENYNIHPDKETAARFTKDKEPFLVQKRLI